MRTPATCPSADQTDVDAAFEEWRRRRAAVEKAQEYLEAARGAEGEARRRLQLLLTDEPTHTTTTETPIEAVTGLERPAPGGPVEPSPTTAGPWRAPAEGAAMSVFLLGTVRIFVGDRLLADLNGARAQLVLRYLLVHRGTAVPRDQLIELMWPGVGTAAGRRNLHQAVYTLRRALKDAGSPRAWITFDHECYSFETDRMWCDVDEFERAAARARRLDNAGDVHGAIDAAEHADGLYVGDLMDDLPYEEWVAPERRRLHQVALEVSTRLGDHLLAADRPEAALAAAQRALAREPTDEAAHCRAMRALAVTGRRGLAARQFQQCAAVLEREFGFGPSEETVALYRDIVGRRLAWRGTGDGPFAPER